MTDSERIAELEKKVRELESKNPQIIIMPAPVYAPSYPMYPMYPMPWNQSVWQPQAVWYATQTGGAAGVSSFQLK